MAIVKRVKDIPKDAQGIFEYVLKHLKSQGKKAMKDGGAVCEYRTTEGLSCAVGCLIPHSRMKFVVNSSVFALNDKALGPELLPHLDLLSSLQNFHDHVWKNASLRDQLKKLQQIASKYNLTLPEWVPAWIYPQGTP